MPLDKTAELMLIELRGDAPLVRTQRDIDGYPVGTLGCVTGVDGPFLTVRLAGSDTEIHMLPRELQEIE